MAFLALICVRCVNPRASMRPKRIFLKRHRDWNSRNFDLKFSASTNCATVRPINITCMRPLDDNKEINVNLSFSCIKPQRILHQIPICKTCLCPIYKQISQCVSTSQTRPFVRCSLVCEIGVDLQLGGKCCELSWYITVTHCRICTVMFVLLTDSVNNRVVPALGKRHE